ncbi:MAG: N,N'-diacetylchitobiose phosphorylase [Clostridiales bacterium]|jgi:N,N'-diacetylchitobiose phosphorylase|nr:N,N'-diacetylchitobiose phosphorylase [Clostridiales bacterium]
MRYGYFDNERREYVIDKVNAPSSWTNYIGVNDMCAVLNQNAGGYVFYKTPQYHRITRFRPNGVPLDRPGHYVYLRDDDTGEYFTISWQPVAKEGAEYTCRHGLSYSKYLCEYGGIEASQTVFIPLGDAVELWDVKIKNAGKKRNLSVYSYAEFSFHHIDIDNQNFQMSLYCAGSSYADGIIEHDLFYEEFGYQYFTSNFEPDGYDCLRDKFLGAYRTETNPEVVEGGKCLSSAELGGNHCAVLQKKITLEEGEDVRLVFMLGEGKRENGKITREKYSDLSYVDKCFADLAAYWDKKLKNLQVTTPNKGMDTHLNIWNLYQAEINVMFSRFASFIEVGGRTGLGYRDTAQDAMCVIHSNPEKCRERIMQLLRAESKEGYGIHLFEPEWFEKADDEKKPFKSPTVVPEVNVSDFMYSLDNVCSDDALWLVSAVTEYVKETGDFNFLREVVTYADGGSGTVKEHLEKILEFTNRQVGENKIAKGLRADWNDCLNLGGGESAMVAFLHVWALDNFLELLHYLKDEKTEYFEKMKAEVSQTTNDVLWDGEWWIRGITKNNKKIGTSADAEGKVHLESNTWAVISGASNYEKSIKSMNSVYDYLFTPYGIMLNAPSYTVPDSDIGFVTRVYPGVKENGAIFSHPNPWAWVAECKLGRGGRAMEYYNALLPYNQNDIIEIREAEPYSYCQFVMGRDHSAHGRARHPFMTGTAGWAYFAASHYMLGIRPGFDSLVIDPCIPADWDGFSVKRIFRGAEYIITVKNEGHTEKGVKKIFLNGTETNSVGICEKGSVNNVEVIMG